MRQHRCTRARLFPSLAIGVSATHLVIIAVCGCVDRHAAGPAAESPAEVARPATGARPASGGVRVNIDARRPAGWLSDYRLFKDLRRQTPNDGVVPYRLNSPQFVDDAQARHYVYLPPSASAVYHDSEVFDFPVGSVLVQTLFYPKDLNDPAAGERTVETRLLIHQNKGWVAVPYLWNEDGSDARRVVVGGKTDVRWRDDDGNLRELAFVTPDMNQCKRCHKREGAGGGHDMVVPIGPKARNLNCEITGDDGPRNQLAAWVAEGKLAGAPHDIAAVSRAAVWNDPATGSVAERARTWLDVNCAHCHNPRGPAAVSGLDLSIEQTDPSRFGVYKAPVAAGRGSSGYQFGIEPGRPERSFLLSRIRSTDPGIMMPTVGRVLADERGAALVEQWIASMTIDQQLAERALHPVAAYRQALSGGDAVRGREIFYQQTKCNNCHTADAPGGNVGPSLVGIASRAQPEYLLESIVAPSAQIVKGYETMTVQTDDGQIINGVVAREDVYELVLKPIDGDEISIPKPSIEQREITANSIMPTMANLLSVEQIADLLAFLRTLKEPEGN